MRKTRIARVSFYVAVGASVSGSLCTGPQGRFTESHGGRWLVGGNWLGGSSELFGAKLTVT